MELATRSMTLPMDLLQKYINPVFIETGTFDGRTVQQALDAGFKDVRSVESDPVLYKTAQKRFHGDKRVKLWFGDSAQVLPEMMAGVRAPITFWLDAHKQDNHASNNILPLLEELKMISRLKIRNDNIIMIDDRRLMGQGFWAEVCESDVVWHLRFMNPRFVIEYVDSLAARGDIILAHL